MHASNLFEGHWKDGKFTGYGRAVYWRYVDQSTIRPANNFTKKPGTQDSELISQRFEQGNFINGKLQKEKKSEKKRGRKPKKKDQ